MFERIVINGKQDGNQCIYFFFPPDDTVYNGVLFVEFNRLSWEKKNYIVISVIIFIFIDSENFHNEFITFSVYQARIGLIRLLFITCILC